MNKKAMFFTMLAITLVSFFLLSYGFYYIVQDREGVNKRIETMNDYVYSIEKDLPRKLYVSGYRIIFLFGKEIEETGNYLDDVNDSFEEAFFNGTINEKSNEEINSLMKKSTFSGIEEAVNERANRINLRVNLSSPEISIYQKNPWSVVIKLKTDIFIKDENELASWNKTSIIETEIPITNFGDPLYVVETKGKSINQINKTPYEDFVDGNDVSNLLSHVENQYYINSTIAPSFLNRLEGNFSDSDNGIESLVYVPDLDSEYHYDRSVVDYIYFSGQVHNTNSVEDMPDWFKLDGNHLGIYEIS